jgi:hypothetical protein
VAEHMECRSRRRHSSRDLSVLDRELTLFIASGWVEMRGSLEPLVAITPDARFLGRTGHRIFSDCSLDAYSQKKTLGRGLSLVSAHTIAALQGRLLRQHIPQAGGEEEAQSEVERVEEAPQRQVYYYNTITEETRLDKPAAPLLAVDGNGRMLVDDEEQRVMPPSSAVVQGACAACLSLCTPFALNYHVHPWSHACLCAP